MIISYNWLKNFLQLNESEHTPQRIADTLNARGIEVEAINDLPPQLDGIIVAQITHIEKHPDSDHLNICKVNDGNQEITLICGAPNIQTLWKVPLAKPGTKINENEIKVSKIRGVTSNGMLCSETELNVGTFNETLLRLPDDTPLGIPLEQALLRHTPQNISPFHNTTFEISLTPDRGDCLSHLGIARELAAAFNLSLNNLPNCLDSLPQHLLSDKLIQIQDPQKCSRYFAAILKNIHVLPSPPWLRRAVEACGARSVNSVVDVTNYVCFELGHPLHTFDLDKLASPKLQVRNANNNEKLLAINHEEYTLTSTDLVIADENQPVALAGVMGGANTEITLNSKAIFLEIAAFDPTSIRKTARRLNCHSESSHRFERFVDPNTIPRAALRTLQLLQACQPDTTIEITQFQDNYPTILQPKTISFNPEKARSILGIPNLEDQQIISILSSANIIATSTNNNTLTLTIPTYRPDLTRDIDLIEEIARAYGVDNIEPVLPQAPLSPQHTLRKNFHNPTPYPLQPTIPDHNYRKNIDTIRNTLISSGYTETLHYSFAYPDDAQKLQLPPDHPDAKPLKIANPLAIEHSAMRTNLLPSALRALKLNLSQQQKSIAIFELAQTYHPQKHNDITILEEKNQLLILCSGIFNSSWNEINRKYDIYDLKAAISQLATAMKWNIRLQKSNNHTYLHPGIQADIIINGKTRGHFGELHPTTAQNFKIDESCYIASIDCTELLKLKNNISRIQPLPIHPKSTRDLAIIIDRTITFDELKRCIDKAKPKILESWSLFDIYTGKQIDQTKQSVALTFTYRDPNAHDPKLGRTLKDEEIKEAHQTILDALKNQFNAELR